MRDTHRGKHISILYLFVLWISIRLCDGFSPTNAKGKLSHRISLPVSSSEMQHLERDPLEKLKAYNDTKPLNSLSSSQGRRDFLVTSLGASLGTVALAGVSARPAAAVTTLSSSQGMQWAPLEKFLSVPQQTTYTKRFISYLARFLLNYDPATKNWWSFQNKILDDADTYSLPFFGRDQYSLDAEKKDKIEELYAELEASVQYGLSKYQNIDGQKMLLQLLLQDFGYSIKNRRQIALLFSLQDTQQPVESLKKLVSENDNVGIKELIVQEGGRGYSLEKPPTIKLQEPFGAKQQMGSGAEAVVELQPVGSLLSIRVDNPGSNYTTVPEVRISNPTSKVGEAATAVAVLKEKRIDRIELRTVGQGYRSADKVEVTIVEPEDFDGTTASATAVLDMKVSRIKVIEKGEGYSFSFPPEAKIDPPSNKKNPDAIPARAKVVLSDPTDGSVRKYWVPQRDMNEKLLELLPSNLIPTYDTCLQRFYINPVRETSSDYCITYEDDQWQIFKRQKISSYYSVLDGPKPQIPVEKERPLDISNYAKFAISGSISAATAHLFLIPIDVVKTKIQTRPSEYTSLPQGFQKVIKEEPKALLDGAGATILGYFVFGTFSFGGTEFFKRYFRELAGPEIAAYYPVPLLLAASAVAGAMAGIAVSPFEALRVRAVSVESYPKSFTGCLQKTIKEGSVKELFEGAPTLAIQEIPFITTKFAVFNAAEKLIYSLYPGFEESVSLSLTVSLFSGMFAGIIASIVSQPFDSMNIKINSKSDKDVNSLPTAFTALMKEGGIPRLYKGILPRAVKSAINIAIQFFMYDFCKRLLHITAEELKLFFDVLSGLQLDTTGP